MPSSPLSRSTDPKAAALVEQFLEEKRKEAPARPAGLSGRGRAILLATLVAACAFVWVAPYPASGSTGEVSPEVLEAGARATVFLAAQRIDRYRETHGRFPARLEHAGVNDAALHFRPGNNGFYTLTHAVGDRQLTWDSRTPARVFLSKAAAVLEGATR